MARVCVRHPFEHSENLCGQCGREFCAGCLVYPKGNRKPPMCVQCALAAGGVRATAGQRAVVSKREIRKRIKERRKEDRAMAELERRQLKLPPIENPFTPGWAIEADAPAPAWIADVDPIDEADGDVEVPARADHSEAMPEALPIAEERPPTLADLLPSMTAPNRAEESAAALASLPTREQQLGWDERGDPEEPDRNRRGLPLLRRREPEPDEGNESSEMIAWLDEVFAPRDQ